MAVPQVDVHPAYIIYRDVPAGEPYDATSPLSFFPPKGSDELFDALRLSFPLLKTHSERMRDAIIQFLLEERQVEQFELSPATTMESSQITWPSASSGSTSDFSSPELLNFATPTSFSHSPQIQEGQQPITSTSNQPSPPSLDQMTGVFSLSSEPQPKQRVRRKMTEAEKIEYRKRRIVKACDKCAKRKRKCPHNQAEMKTVSTPTISTKSSSPQSIVSTQPPMLLSNQYTSQAFDGFFDVSNFGSFDDFNMFDDPLPEASVDDFFHFECFEDSPTLFNNVKNKAHEPFVPPQSMLHNAVAQGAHGNELRGIPSQDGVEDRLAELRTPTPSNHPTGSPDARFQAHTQPSQRAMRNSHTDDLRSETRVSSITAKEQSGQMNVVDPLGSSNSALRAPCDRPSLAASNHSIAVPLSEAMSASDRNVPQLRPTGSSSHQALATTSSSVSILSESSATRSAVLQGMPQPAALTDSSVGVGQRLDRTEDSRHQRSLGEGICRSDGLATELYMLRRRLPAMRRPTTHENREEGARVATQKLSANTRRQQSPEQLSAQANGGSKAPEPVRETFGLPQEGDRAQHAARPITNYTVAGARGVSSSQNIAPSLPVPSTADLVSQNRLSDHVRYKDHHGRPDGHGFSKFAFTLGAFALLAMFSPSISALCLVLLLTRQSSNETGSSEGLVQCTQKNSSWLSTRTQRYKSRSDIGLKVLETRQYVPGGGVQAWMNLFEAGPDAWLRGLMYPFRLSPVCTFG